MGDETDSTDNDLRHRLAALEDEVQSLRNDDGAKSTRRMMLKGGVAALGLGALATPSSAGTNQAGAIGGEGATLDLWTEDLYIVEQGSTPSAPPSGYIDIYAKTDGNFYKLQSDGTESLLGGDGLSPGEDFDGQGTSDFTNLSSVSTERASSDSIEYDAVLAEIPSGYVAFRNESDNPNVQYFDTGENALRHARDNCPEGGDLMVRGTVTMTGRVDFGGGRTIHNGHFDTQFEAGDDGLIGTVGTVASEISIGADVSRGDQTIPISDTSPFSEFDMVVLESDRTYPSHTREIGESHIVDSVNSTDGTLTLTDPIEEDYATADNGKLYLIEPDSFSVRGTEFTGPGENATEAVALSCKLGERPEVRDCVFQDFGKRSILFVSCHRPTAIENHIERSNLSEIGYGVALSNANSHAIVKGNTFRRCRHGVSHVAGPDALGLNRNSRILDNDFEGGGKDSMVDIHSGSTISATLKGNNVRGSWIRGVARTTHLIDNHIQSGEGIAAGWHDRGPASMENVELFVRDNDFYSSNIRMYLSTDISVFSAKGNTFHGQTRSPFWFEIDIGTLELHNNTARQSNTGDGTSSYAVDVDATVGGGTITRNDFRESSESLIAINGGTDIRIAGNVLVNPNRLDEFAPQPIRFRSNVRDSIVERNEIRNDNGFANHAVKEENTSGGNRFIDNEVSGHQSTAFNIADDSVAVDNPGSDDATGTPPSSPKSGWKYLDDGTNRDGYGYRVFDSGAWRDL